MTSLFNWLFGHFPWDSWPFRKLKRLRGEEEALDENSDSVVSPPKRARVGGAATNFRPKTLREPNQTTVTTVRKRSVLPEKPQSKDYTFQRPSRTTQPPSFNWIETSFGNNENEMPKLQNNPRPNRRGRRNMNSIASIDLTDDEPSLPSVSNRVSYVDITSDDPTELGKKSRSSISKRMPPQTPFIRSTIDLTEDEPQCSGSNNIPYIDITKDDCPGLEKNSRKVNRSSLPSQTSFMRNRNSAVNQDMRTTPRRRFGSFKGSLGSNDVSHVNSTFKRSLQRTASGSSLSFMQSYDLQERMNFSKLLGSVVSFKKPPVSFNKTRAPTAIIDLSNEEDPDVSEVLSKSRSPENKKIIPQSSASTSSDVSSSTKRGVNKELLRVNSFEQKVKEKKYANENWLEQFFKDYNAQCAEFTSTKEKLEQDVRLWSEESRLKVEELLNEKLTRHLKITESLIPEAPKDPYPPIIRPLPELTSEMEALIESSHSKRPNDIIIQKHSYTIKKCDLQTLYRMSWLNDEVISFYMVLIDKRNESTEGYPPIHVFNTFFYEALRKRGYDGVKRWTRKVNIFEKDIIIVPIHLQVHWCLLTADLKKKEINYYDSMGSSNDECLRIVSQYLQMEHKTKMGTELDLSDWKISNVKNIPQQMNGSDCGVFACTYAEFSSRRAPFDFDQSKMPYFRRKMTYEIMQGELL